MDLSGAASAIADTRGHRRRQAVNTHQMADGHDYYYSGLRDVVGDEGEWPLHERWPDVAAHTEFRPDDEVLDIGCAEGLLTLQVAPMVKSIRGIELQPQRIEAARILATRRGVSNADFEVGSICDTRLRPMSYDVVLFLGVFHHLPLASKMLALAKLLSASRRQCLIRTPLLRGPARHRLTNIEHVCRTFGFSHTMVQNQSGRGGDLIVARRRSQGRVIVAHRRHRSDPVPSSRIRQTRAAATAEVF